MFWDEQIISKDFGCINCGRTWLPADTPLDDDDVHFIWHLNGCHSHYSDGPLELPHTWQVVRI